MADTQNAHEHHHAHKEHDHHKHHSHMVSDFKKRFLISIIITIPILVLSPMIQGFLGVNWQFSYDYYILFALSSFVFFYGGWPFLTGAVEELKDKNPGMMTLIGLAITIAYGYSSLIVFGLEVNDLFWELATLVDIMLLGHWIEMRSVMGASNALEKLIELIPNKAHKWEGNETKEVPTSSLMREDRILVKPGEKIPVDGFIIDGASTVDESMLTGESVPTHKGVDEEVIGGSINNEGSLTLEVTKTGDDSYLSQVVTLVKEAQDSQSKTQDFTNRAAKWLFYLALAAGALTLLVWLMLGYSFDTSLERMVTVMVITCPHALGLAAPLVVAVSTSISAKQGLLIRNRANFERGRNLNAVVFDKTGTLTEGAFGVTDIIAHEGYSKEEVLRNAASIEQQSEHPIAVGIVQSAKEKDLNLQTPKDFQSMTGKGIEGVVDGKKVHVVGPNYVNDTHLSYDHDQFEQLSAEGKTVVFVVIDDDTIIGMIALADMIRPSAKEAVSLLKAKGIHSIMLTGDNEKVANWVAEQIDIEEVYAEVLPDHKSDKIKEIQAKGWRVAMTGDGINDAPALATADLGIAIGTGTDIAMETADVVLVKSNPKDVISLIDLSQKTYQKMVQNLWWAAGYNIFAIPLAAGVLAPIGMILSPAVGAILMSLSTIVVAINAKLLKV